MKIGIIGCRGIPNNYGGFEQFAEQFGTYAVSKAHEVIVYCSSTQTYMEKEFNGVKLIRCNDPQKSMGTSSQFVYDLNCILDSRSQNFDVILQLGYTSNAIWNFLYRSSDRVITNMDGMEWKRAKYNFITKQFLKVSEFLVVKRSNSLIADSTAIENYLNGKYNKKTCFIPYGASIFENPEPKILQEYGLEPFSYNLIIARMEPENNIEMIILGHLKSAIKVPLIIVGDTNNSFGKYLTERYRSDQIRFIRGIYSEPVLNNLRYYSKHYFHGHSVGGTNPSLLEAMGCSADIVAHQNEFNRMVLGKDALYFSTADEISTIIQQITTRNLQSITNNLLKIGDIYNWDKLNDKLLKTLTGNNES